MVFLYYVEIVCLRMPKKDNTYARERSCSARQNSVDYGRKKEKEKKKHALKRTVKISSVFRMLKLDTIQKKKKKKLRKQNNYNLYGLKHQRKI